MELPRWDVRPWGGQHGRRKLLWQFTVAIKSDPVLLPPSGTIKLIRDEYAGA